jgi:hypothetical protein
LIEGGQLWKIRMPLPVSDPDEVMPQDLRRLTEYMRQNYGETGEWWGSGDRGQETGDRENPAEDHIGDADALPEVASSGEEAAP